MIANRPSFPLGGKLDGRPEKPKCCSVAVRAISSRGRYRSTPQALAAPPAGAKQGAVRDALAPRSSPRAGRIVCGRRDRVRPAATRPHTDARNVAIAVASFVGSRIAKAVVSEMRFVLGRRAADGLQDSCTRLLDLKGASGAPPGYFSPRKRVTKIVGPRAERARRRAVSGHPAGRSSIVGAGGELSASIA